MKRLFLLVALVISISANAQCYFKQNGVLISLDTYKVDYIQLAVPIAQGQPVQLILNDTQQMPYYLRDKNGKKLKMRIVSVLSMFDDDWELLYIKFDDHFYRVIFKRKGVMFH